MFVRGAIVACRDCRRGVPWRLSNSEDPRTTYSRAGRARVGQELGVQERISGDMPRGVVEHGFFGRSIAGNVMPGSGRRSTRGCLLGRRGAGGGWIMAEMLHQVRLRRADRVWSPMAPGAQPDICRAQGIHWRWW